MFCLSVLRGRGMGGYSVLQSVAACVAVCCSVLQCVCCSVLRCDAVCCTTKRRCKWPRGGS